MDPNTTNLFTGFTGSFDDESKAAADSFTSDSRRRDSWPVLQYKNNSQTGNSEVNIRILPLPVTKTRGHWVKTKKNKTYWEDCPAYDPQSHTSNGYCPICELKVSGLTENSLVYVIDFAHLQLLHSMGVTPDRYQPPVPGQPMLLHPYRVFNMSKSILAAINNIRAKKGSASDPATGYGLNITRMDKNGKVEYQVIPLDNYPVDVNVLTELGRLQMPNTQEWHEPSDHSDIVKSLFFNGHVGFDQAVAKLEDLFNRSLCTLDKKEASIKALNTYQSSHGGAAGTPGIPLPPPGQMAIPMPQVGAAPVMPPPGMPAMQPPMMMPPPGIPTMAPPQMAQVPMAPPQMAHFPGATASTPEPQFTGPQIPVPPTLTVPVIPVIPAVPQMPGIPAMPQIPAVPAVPQMPGIPAMPQIPGVPGVAIPGDTGILG